jgi:5'(3')-deoxyribonucleotidase
MRVERRIPLRVAIDFDSVLSDLAALQVVSYNIKHGTSLAKDDIDDWWWWKQQAHPEFVWGDECFHNEQWMMATPPVSGAIVGANALRDEFGIMTYVVTQRPDHHRRWVEAWIDQHRIIVNDVYLSSDDQPKASIYRNLKIDVGIDDAPHNVEELATICPMILFDQPWNREVATGGATNIVRADSWEVVNDIVFGTGIIRHQERPRQAPDGPDRAGLLDRDCPGADLWGDEVQHPQLEGRDALRENLRRPATPPERLLAG